MKGISKLITVLVLGATLMQFNGCGLVSALLPGGNPNSNLVD
jgi:hypothetical protein